MYPPDGGEILVDGTPLADLDPAAWRARCTAAFQDFARFHLPAVESVGVADLPGRTDEPAAQAALDRAGAADLAEPAARRAGHQVGTVYTGGHGLSGGQWQKLALGRAMRRDDPLLVVLDEPTASLDAQSEHALFERYAATATREAGTQRRGHGPGVAPVLHGPHGRPDHLRGEGHPVECGSHEDLMARGGRYAELFDLQAAAYR